MVQAAGGVFAATVAGSASRHLLALALRTQPGSKNGLPPRPGVARQRSGPPTLVAATWISPLLGSIRALHASSDAAREARARENHTARKTAAARADRRLMATDRSTRRTAQARRFASLPEPQLEGEPAARSLAQSDRHGVSSSSSEFRSAPAEGAACHVCNARASTFRR